MACDFKRIVEDAKFRSGVLDRGQIAARLAEIAGELPETTWRRRAALLDERDFLETSARILDEGRYGQK